jgi:hypothetical protein
MKSKGTKRKAKKRVSRKKRRIISSVTKSFYLKMSTPRCYVKLLYDTF